MTVAAKPAKNPPVKYIYLIRVVLSDVTGEASSATNVALPRFSGIEMFRFLRGVFSFFKRRGRLEVGVSGVQTHEKSHSSLSMQA